MRLNYFILNYKILLENAEMPKNDNFQSFAFIFERLEISLGNIEKIVKFLAKVLLHAYFVQKKLEIVLFPFRSQNLLENVKNIAK